MQDVHGSSTIATFNYFNNFQQLYYRY